MTLSVHATPRKPRLLGLCMVKNEQDVIEAFVRHNLRLLDQLVVIDNGSVDGTRRILALLSAEFPNLHVTEDDRFGYNQAERMTAWLHEYQELYAADFFFPLDADEFLDALDPDAFFPSLASIPAGGFGAVPWCTYVLTPETLTANPAEPDSLRRMTFRRTAERPVRSKAVLRLDGRSARSIQLTQGNHTAISQSGALLPGIKLPALRLLHFPVRSRDQLVAKSIVGWMAYLAFNLRAGETKLGHQWRLNFEEFTGDTPLDELTLCERSLLYTQDPRPIVWENDVVAEPDRLVYQRRFSTGASLSAVQLIARSWELAVTGINRYSPSVRIAAMLDSLNPSTGTEAPEIKASDVPQHRDDSLASSSAEPTLEDLMQRGEFRRALLRIEADIVRQESAELWSDWATVQCASGDMPQAEIGYRRALRLEPGHRAGCVNLALLFLARGRLQEGMTLLEPHTATLTQPEIDVIQKLSSPFRTRSQSLQAAEETPAAPHARQSHRRFLLVVRAGDASLHPTWLEGSKTRNWDLLVHSFGKTCPWQSSEGVEILQAQGDDIQGPKLRAMHSLYQQRRQQFLDYDYVCFADDDLAMDVDTINRMFTLAQHYNLEYAQPALTPDSCMANWHITMQNSSFLLRYTNFVEVMCPIFSRAFLELCIPTFIENISGYGLDILWSSWVSSPWKIAILDACPVRHTRPSYSGKLYESLAARGVSPDQELIALIKKWRLIPEKDQRPGQVIVPTSIIRGGILKDQTRLTIADGQGIDLMRALQNGFPAALTDHPARIVVLLHPIMMATLERSSQQDADPDRPVLATKN